jgi:hypothetical protein
MRHFEAATIFAEASHKFLYEVLRTIFCEDITLYYFLTVLYIYPYPLEKGKK